LEPWTGENRGEVGERSLPSVRRLGLRMTSTSSHRIMEKAAFASNQSINYAHIALMPRTRHAISSVIYAKHVIGASLKMVYQKPRRCLSLRYSEQVCDADRSLDCRSCASLESPDQANKTSEKYGYRRCKKTPAYLSSRN
jgi:hypothetical protein